MKPTVELRPMFRYSPVGVLAATILIIVGIFGVIVCYKTIRKKKVAIEMVIPPKKDLLEIKRKYLEKIEELRKAAVGEELASRSGSVGDGSVRSGNAGDVNGGMGEGNVGEGNVGDGAGKGNAGNDAENGVRRRISSRKAYQELSGIIRNFIFEATNIRVQNYTLVEIRAVNMPILYELVSEYYDPEFAAISGGDIGQAIEKTKGVIERWN